jgi:hypothetical protein
VTSVVCPNGHRFRTRIVYGMPTPELLEASGAGKRVVIAGCDPGDPVELTCPTCSVTFEWASRSASESVTEGQAEAAPG